MAIKDSYKKFSDDCAKAQDEVNGNVKGFITDFIYGSWIERTVIIVVSVAVWYAYDYVKSLI